MSTRITVLSMSTPFACPGCHKPTRETLDGRCAACLHRALLDELGVGNELRRALAVAGELPTLPSDARLTAALREVRTVLNHGETKRRAEAWRDLSIGWHIMKAEGHRRRTGRSVGSGQTHRAHAIARELFALQLELEREGRS